MRQGFKREVIHQRGTEGGWGHQHRLGERLVLKNKRNHTRWPTMATARGPNYFYQNTHTDADTQHTHTQMQTHNTHTDADTQHTHTQMQTHNTHTPAA